MRQVIRGLIVASWVLVVMSADASAATCESLLALKLRDVAITQAQVVPAGLFVLPQGFSSTTGDAPLLRDLPAFCRVAATLKPSRDSHIEIEVWLPIDSWNGKFLAVGNGGWAGRISYAPGGRSLIDGVRRGYATASTDTGHNAPPGQAGGEAHFAIGHPEKLIDLGYRAVHEMTITSKALIAQFYGRAPGLSYWNGCSTGGRQGLVEAQRYPGDFDGIVAGAPANYWTHLHTWDLSVAVPALNNPASLIPRAKLTLLNNAVLATCDASDGVKDGVLNDPPACTFSPATLACRAGDATDCLTAPQLESVARVYASAKTASGQEAFPGKEPGSESTWTPISSEARQPVDVALGSFQIAYSNPDWDWRGFNLDRDMKAVDERLGPVLNAVNPDLDVFKARGGKLILFHGWNDTLISPRNTVNYYSSVVTKMGSSQDSWLRLFMAPGMNHCGGGVGPNTADWLSALERWRESNVAPDRIVATRANEDHTSTTRPLCAYPQLAQYVGTGSTNDAANFVCKDK